MCETVVQVKCEPSDEVVVDITNPENLSNLLLVDQQTIAGGSCLKKVDFDSETLARSCINSVVSRSCGYPLNVAKECDQSRKSCRKRRRKKSDTNFINLQPKCIKLGTSLSNASDKSINDSDISGDDQFREGAKFSSFDEFLTAFEKWKNQEYQPFLLVHSTPLRRMDDGQQDCTLKYNRVAYYCAYFGSGKQRDFELNSAQSTLSSGCCRAQLKLNYCPAENVLKLTTLNTRHYGHVITAENYFRLNNLQFDNFSVVKKLSKQRTTAKDTLQTLCKKRLKKLNLWQSLEKKLLKEEAVDEYRPTSVLPNNIVPQLDRSVLLETKEANLTLNVDIKLGSKFNSFDHFCSTLKMLKNETGYSFRIFSSKLITSEDRLINEKMKYRYLLYRCVSDIHSKKISDTRLCLKEKPPKSPPHSCSALISLLFSKVEKVLYVNKCNPNHSCGTNCLSSNNGLNNEATNELIECKQSDSSQKFAYYRNVSNTALTELNTNRYDDMNNCNILALSLLSDTADYKAHTATLPSSPASFMSLSQEFETTTVDKDCNKNVAALKPNKEGCIEIQRRACRRLQQVSLCLDCSEISSSVGMECRFKNFRRFKKRNQSLCSVGFVKYRYCESSYAFKENFHWEFLPPNFPKIAFVETACFILRNINKSFDLILAKEHKFLASALRWKILKSSSHYLPWRDVRNVREMCDVCSTTLFNLHLICNFCGFAVCPDCVYARTDDLTKQTSKNSMNRDNYGWYYCTIEKKPIHRPSSLRLVQLIPDPDSQVLSVLSALNTRLGIQLERYASKVTDSISTELSSANNLLFLNDEPNCLHDESQHSFYFDGAMLILNEVNNTCNFSLFQKHWSLCLPVLIKNTTNNLNHSIWSPAVLKEKCLSQSSPGSIVDCRLGAIIDNFDISKFWDGFVDCQKRVRSVDGRKLYLKLKDWPPVEKFSNVLPEHFADFCNSLPIPEYTHPKNGQFNLTTNLPSFCVEPDLGPKLYCAYDMIFEPTRCTTNLHMDVSCAVNVLVSVTTPANVNSAYLYDHILKHLEEQRDLDPVDLQRAKEHPDKIGALWSIFRPQDSIEIREFLNEVAAEYRIKNVDDPIHDQMSFLNVDLRRRLANERGIKGFTFVQMLGDAVFIPAGAAHQVQNMLCCIKVAEDFVSPEGVSRCALVANEFRNLTAQHNNHEDKLQLPNIILHSVRQAVRTLELNEP